MIIMNFIIIYCIYIFYIKADQNCLQKICRVNILFNKSWPILVFLTFQRNKQTKNMHSHSEVVIYFKIP